MARVGTEGSEYNLLERIVYLFLIPAVFTAILTVVLLNLFGYNVTDPILRAANRVPLLERIVPDPPKEAPPAAGPSASGQEGAEQPSVDEAVLRLESELSAARAGAAAKDARIAELEQRVSELQTELEARTLDREEYLTEIRRLARVYEDMSASRAAPILEQLGTLERMLILSQMSTEAQTRILARMTPAVAAETTLQQLADFRARLFDSSEAGPKTGFSREELGRTISGMAPNSAALMLIELAKTDEGAAVGLLRGMDVQSRAAVMSAIALESQETAARLAAGLAAASGE